MLLVVAAFHAQPVFSQESGAAKQEISPSNSDTVAEADSKAVPDGDEIMRKVRENEYSESMKSLSHMTLEDKNGKKQERFFTLQRQSDNVLIRFLEPPDLKNIGYLVLKNEKDPENDFIYVYFPPPTDDYRQINVDDKDSNESFLGSDFDITDFQIRNPDETVNTYLKTEIISGNTCHVVESVPKDKEYKYSKMIFWVSTRHWLPVKAQFFDRKSKEMVKEMKVFKIKTMGGRKVISKFQMTTLATDHKTLLDVKEVEFDVTFSDGTFTIRRLTNP